MKIAPKNKLLKSTMKICNIFGNDPPQNPGKPCYMHGAVAEMELYLLEK
jgi:hypothetical protein